MVEQHTTLPLESYIHELEALTNILVVCKNEHSTIAEKIFMLDLLRRLGDTLASDIIRNFEFGQKNYMTINTYITQASQSMPWVNHFKRKDTVSSAKLSKRVMQTKNFFYVEQTNLKLKFQGYVRLCNFVLPEQT
ncbi:unnamed protein product [Rhizopus stolonifer]